MRRSKSRKCAKVGDVRPLFAFCGGLVVVIKRGCGCFGVSGMIIFDIESKRRWYLE